MINKNALKVLLIIFFCNLLVPHAYSQTSSAKGAIAQRIVETRALSCFFQSGSSSSGLLPRYARVNFEQNRIISSEPLEGKDLNTRDGWRTRSEEYLVRYSDINGTEIFSTSGYNYYGSEVETKPYGPAINSAFVDFTKGASEVGITMSRIIPSPKRPDPPGLNRNIGEGADSAVYEMLISLENAVYVFRCDYSFLRKLYDLIYFR